MHLEGAIHCRSDAVDESMELFPRVIPPVFVVALIQEKIRVAVKNINSY